MTQVFWHSLRMPQSLRVSLGALADAMLSSLRALVLALAPTSGDYREVLAGVRVANLAHKTFSNHCFDWPMAVLTIQGAKLIEAGPYKFELRSGTLLVTCVDMPSISSVLTASPERPYLSLIVSLDRNILAEQVATFAPVPASDAQCASAWTEKADLEYLDIFRRIAAFALQPAASGALLALLMRELHLRLLSDPRAALLRSLYWRNSRESRLSGVINWLRAHVSTPVNMEYLARMANMSISSFHRHFKAITGSSPLQYHKKLRLYEAQRIMLSSDLGVAETAVAVGYESITQFNREYRRMFGLPPGRDILQRKKRLNASQDHA